MSGTFKGFTEKDIERLKNSKNDSSAKKAFNKSKISAHSVTLRKMSGEQKFEIIDHNARLSTQPVQENASDEKVELKPKTEIEMTEFADTSPIPVETENSSNGVKIEELHDVSLITKDDLVEVEKPRNLEEFQKHQKLIEEQNRKRREMLSKALEDRSKKTADEVERLNMIKKEFQTLDLQLSDDVAILRKKIEKACLIYTEAEKNYFRVEKEFLNAKLTLQKEKEKKELLTEHLCTLIAHNEARKAKKLESLMDQLAYSTTDLNPPNVSDGVCELTGKMLEMENGQVVVRDD